MASKVKVSIDFDGVLTDHFFRFLYTRDKKSNRIVPPLQYFWLVISSYVHPPTKGCKKALETLSQQDFDLYLTTSRIKDVCGITERWLARHKLSIFFTEVNCNLQNLPPWEFKFNTLKDKNFDVHIDDSVFTLTKLNELLPDLHLIRYNPHASAPLGFRNTKECSSWEEIVEYLNSEQFRNRSGN